MKHPLYRYAVHTKVELEASIDRGILRQLYKKLKATHGAQYKYFNFKFKKGYMEDDFVCNRRTVVLYANRHKKPRFIK
jgi:hypothetical protein